MFIFDRISKTIIYIKDGDTIPTNIEIGDLIEHPKYSGEPKKAINGQWVPSPDKAKETLVNHINERTQRFVNNTPEAEVKSWTIKSQAAEAYQAGTATAKQTQLLNYEASKAGETVDSLVQRILTNATAYEAIIFQLSGVRQKYFVLFDSAPDVDTLKTYLQDAKNEVDTVISNVLSPSV